LAPLLPHKDKKLGMQDALVLLNNDILGLGMERLAFKPIK
jgi:hypothetical protein